MNQFYWQTLAGHITQCKALNSAHHSLYRDVQWLSCVWLCHPVDCSTPPLSFTISWRLLKLMSIELVMPSNYQYPLLLLPSVFPASGSFPVNWLFTSGGKSIEVSVSASVLPMNDQGWFPLGFTGLIFLMSKGLSRVFSSTTVQKHQLFSAQPHLCFHIHTWLLEKS